MRSRTLSGGAAACLLGLAGLAGLVAAAEAKTVKIVRVDCAEGDSIQAALEHKADELIIEIRGMCEEPVVIRRDNVTLRGSDPAADGIEGEGPTQEPTYRALVRVDNAQSVPGPSGFGAIRLENLTLRRSPTRGVEAFGGRAVVLLSNCRIVDNDRGLQMHTGGHISLEDSLIADNGLGVMSFLGGFFVCTRCTLEGSEGWLAAAWGGWISFFDSALSTDWWGGAVASSGGRISGTNSSVSAGAVGLYAGENGEIGWQGGEVSGSIWADTKSLVKLVDVEQTGNPSGNLITEDSTLLVGGSTLPGLTTVAELSNGTIKNGSAVGDLHCESGGNLWCDGTEAKSDSTCGLCP